MQTSYILPYLLCAFSISLSLWNATNQAIFFPIYMSAALALGMMRDFDVKNNPNNGELVFKMTIIKLLLCGLALTICTVISLPDKK